MSFKHDTPVLIALITAFAAALAALFFFHFPFIPSLSTLLFFTIAVESAGKTPGAFILGVITTIVGLYFKDPVLNSEQPFAVALLLVVLWVGFSLMHWYRKGIEKNRWELLVSKDEEMKEAKDLRSEIALYEQRHSELSQKTAHRRLLSNAARELGALLDPKAIQSKLIQISQLIFPGQQVEMSYGQHRDGLDTYVFQKRQPVLVPSDLFKGPPLMAVPISVQRSVVGVLRVGGEGLKESRKIFSREDLRLLDVLGSLASLAMDNCQLFQQVQQSALRDNLTGLLTQRVFQEDLDAAILEASRYGHPLSLILADIDHFKAVNDTYGHQAGDQVLQGFAHILDRNARDVDIVCRHGGEEFSILLLQTSHEEACATAERIRLDLAEQGFETEKGAISVTGSFGVATFPEDATSAQQLFRQADQRLYKAKNSGRNRTKGRVG